MATAKGAACRTPGQLTARVAAGTAGFPARSQPTACGRGQAERCKAAVARQEIERKAERQRRAAIQRAEDGRPPLGVRLTGYTTKGEVIEHEAGIVRQVFDRFLAGDTLLALAAWLSETGVPTRHGHPWNPSTVRSMLVNPRYAGRAIYQGAENGHRGAWPALVDEAVFGAVNGKLSDPRRRTQQGTARRYLGSGLFLCGVCDTPLHSHGSAKDGARYRCPQGGHLTRSAIAIDDYVLRVLRERLGRPDLSGLLAAPDGEESRALTAEISSLRARIFRTETDYDSDLIDGHRYKVKMEKLRAQLGAALTARARLAANSGVGKLLVTGDPVAAFDAAPLGIKRAVLELFLTVRLLPAPRGRRGLDPETVKITWQAG
jgi:site-specific DNA recombinase